VEFPDFGGVRHRGRRSAQAFAVLRRMSQAGPCPFPQDFPFELGKDGQ
jgi:hypothetical protein